MSSDTNTKPTLTVEAAKAARDVLRQRIRLALNEFAAETGLTVKSLNLLYPHHWVDIEVHL